MCCGPFDYDYPTFGGKQLRANRSHGRVGSILSDPMTSVSGPAAESNLTAPPDPIVVDPDEETVDLENDEDFNREEDLKFEGLDDDLEPIEPLRNGDSIKPPETDSADDSTASTRWRPRPLR